jgi:hypothetical protein
MISSEVEWKFVQQLREEANNVKDCFNKFSFASLTFSSAVFSLIVSIMEKNCAVVLAAIPVVALLNIVCRIGIYKYSTANRNFGYELHLARWNMFITENSVDEKFNNLNTIRWEEALRAWRVIQTTIMRSLYNVPENSGFKSVILRPLNVFSSLRPDLYRTNKNARKRINKYKKSILTKDIAERQKIDDYPWFLPNILSIEHTNNLSNYHAGTYLSNMLMMLFVMQIFILAPLGYYGINSICNNEYNYFIIFVLAIIYVILRFMRIRRRRLMLENEILSIHSCAILWEAVCISHIIATSNSSGYFKHYTENLIEISREITSNIFSIHKWFEEKLVKN